MDVVVVLVVALVRGPPGRHARPRRPGGVRRGELDRADPRVGAGVGGLDLRGQPAGGDRGVGVAAGQPRGAGVAAVGRRPPQQQRGARRPRGADTEGRRRQGDDVGRAGPGRPGPADDVGAAVGAPVEDDDQPHRHVGPGGAQLLDGLAQRVQAAGQQGLLVAHGDEDADVTQRRRPDRCGRHASQPSRRATEGSPAVHTSSSRSGSSCATTRASPAPATASRTPAAVPG